MIELILRNLFILYIGACVRYLLLRIFKGEKKFSSILHGIPEKNKTDEKLNVENEFINRLLWYCHFNNSHPYHSFNKLSPRHIRHKIDYCCPINWI